LTSVLRVLQVKQMDCCSRTRTDTH